MTVLRFCSARLNSAVTGRTRSSRPKQPCQRWVQTHPFSRDGNPTRSSARPNGSTTLAASDTSVLDEKHHRLLGCGRSHRGMSDFLEESCRRISGHGGQKGKHGHAYPTGFRPRIVLATAALLIASGSGVLALAAEAGATGTLVVTPSTNLAGGQSVTVTGSGLADSSTGSVLECNNASGEPTVDLPAPISKTVPVSCSGISIAKLASTTASGTLSTTFTIVSPTPGPPCDGSNLVACPSTDSAGHTPASDAANYPCPPTAAQLAASDSCYLTYGDQGGDQVSQNISFSGGSGNTGTTGDTGNTGTTEQQQLQQQRRPQPSRPLRRHNDAV